MILNKDNNTKENRKIFFQGVKEEQERRKKNVKPVESERPVYFVPFWVELKKQNNE